MSLNKVMLIGHVGKDPETFTTDSGVKVCNFSLATTESYTNKAGEKVKTTEWHKLVVWGKLVDIIENYVDKGKQIYAEGRLRTRSYENKEDQKVYTTEIYVSNIILLGSKGEGKAKTEQQIKTAETISQTVTIEDDSNNDLPF